MTVLLLEHGASRSAKKWRQRYQHWFSTKGIDTLTLSTTAHGVDILTLHGLLERANEVVVFGGDGTLHRLINQLTVEQAQRLLISIIPCGTGNDFARDLKLLQPDWRMCDEERLSQQRVDIGEIDGIRFVNAASTGLTADLIERQSPRLKRYLGKYSYLFGVLGWWFQYRPDASNQPVLNSVLAGAYLGGGIKLAPQAVRDSGQLTHVRVQAASKWQLLGVLWAVLRKRHDRHPLVSMTQCAQITVQPSAMEIDGERYPSPQQSGATVLEKFIKIRCQRDAR